MGDAKETPLRDLVAGAQKHYLEISDEACHFNSLIPQALEFYGTFANIFKLMDGPRWKAILAKKPRSGPYSPASGMYLSVSMDAWLDEEITPEMQKLLAIYEHYKSWLDATIGVLESDVGDGMKELAKIRFETLEGFGKILLGGERKDEA